MKAISKVEQDVNQIRLKIYEKTKDMSPAQLMESGRDNAQNSKGEKIIMQTVNPVGNTSSNMSETIAEIRALRKKFASAFKGENIKELIEEGRK